MKLLVIGSGGREHALAWKFLQSSRAMRPIKVFVAPGNAGTALEDGLENLAITEIPELVEFARKESIAFTIVGPEAPLAEGIVDAFRAEGQKIFGPAKQAAQLESSKDFSKAFMMRHGIPTAAYATFSSPAEAHHYLDQKGAPIVIKADGLAGGKGVIVAMTVEEAHVAVDAMLVENQLGTAGGRVVIEEFLEGEEASFIVMADGRNVLPLATSQDHKRLKDGDQGPNTGGMGAYSPAPVITPALHARIMREVIQATMNGMEKEGECYTGFLYVGLMVAPGGSIKVLEFNCRMGDPETEVIMLRLKSDLITLMEHALSGTLDKAEAEWDRRTGLGVVMAAHGYPDSPRKGDVITGLPKLMPKEISEKDSYVFHAGTAVNKENRKEIVTAGGRVLCVTALADGVKLAQRRAYEIADQIHFDGCQMRHDIGHWAINKHRK
ncbi:MAG: phosphoribosylamine--glycine ligase [Pseudomonadota bacterium]|nr:phosphoribosylamine--glycine ligase [Pseudomonadota bacterium]